MLVMTDMTQNCDQVRITGLLPSLSNAIDLGGFQDIWMAGTFLYCTSLPGKEPFSSVDSHSC